MMPMLPEDFSVLEWLVRSDTVMAFIVVISLLSATYMWVSGIVIPDILAYILAAFVGYFFGKPNNPGGNS